MVFILTFSNHLWFIYDLLHFLGEDEQPVKFTGSLETKRIDSPIPFPLPMPAFGGYFAPLSDMLPDTNLPNPPYQRYDEYSETCL